MKYRTWLEYAPDVFGDTKAPKAVNNLDWLLHNWKLVDFFTLEKTTEMASGFDQSLLIAHLKLNPRGIKSYHCYFMEWTIAENFLKRPVFFGLKLNGKIISKS